ncbi:SGNH/GDSL hydrolase family protein [Aspergillus mulundensis]|uniref:SGNH hydrolase-type esterase domain-containing protein n=1 Tax=Aspergillus mulundensis TaxID=1810919 RepID=A0A3D8SD31_9EURO|nr:hypothetical protein DSM5745_04545 [Aspergillus mulundensis]RDW84219.1 hypothetical protein DSM5745_04545 [Aspergillus mulundensis]
MRLTKSFIACAIWTVSAVGLPTTSRTADKHWLATWTATTQEVQPSNLPPSPFGGASADFQFRNTTLRQTVRVSVGAERLRFQFSNLFGLTDLPITAASVALPEGGVAGVGEIDTSTIKGLTFDGADSLTIPPGEIVYSDPIDYPVPALTNIAISIYSAEGQKGVNITGHPGSRTTSWFETGDQVNAPSVSDASVERWYLISAVEAWAPKREVGLVILGDSITDGRGSTDNANNRWPDALAERLYQNKVTHVAVNNQAAGGNRVLLDETGPALITRYHRDAIGQKGVKYVMIFEGVNDIGMAATNDSTQTQIFNDLVDAYIQIIRDCKETGLVTIGATITPFANSGYGDSRRERTRLQVNEWILNESPFDHTLDFASFIGDGDALKPEFDSGDHLHPNPAAYRELAASFDLEIFRR